MDQSKAARLAHNVWVSKHFAIAMGAIMVIFIVCHWIHVAWFKYGRRSSALSNTAPIRYLRMMRRILAINVLGEQINRWILYFVYWAVNLILLLTNNQLDNHTYVAKRLGWITVTNLMFLVFLALRNTPLTPLSGQSYEKLRPLHKTAGYTCIISAVLHAGVYLPTWHEAGILSEMQLTENLAGAIAGLSMLIIGLTTISWFRNRAYELFYIIHVALFILILVMVALHRPNITTSTLVIIIFTACLWFSDRLIRFVKLCWYFPGNHATLTAMPNNAVRITLNRPIHSSPGCHAYLWIPGIRLMETHPFTLVSQNPAQFVVRAYDGFTQDLHKVASQYPNGKTLRCSVDGAYGQVPDFFKFDRVLLVAGGSGASFTFSVALDMVRKYHDSDSDSTKMMDFVWVVRNYESVMWFEQELNELLKNSHVRLFIYVTREVTSKQTETTTTESKDNVTPTTTEQAILDAEKGVMTRETTASSISQFSSYITKGRPDISSHLASCVESLQPTNSVGIGACGPLDLIELTRKAVSQDVYDSGPSITLHAEEFGW